MAVDSLSPKVPVVSLAEFANIQGLQLQELIDKCESESALSHLYIVTGVLRGINNARAQNWKTAFNTTIENGTHKISIQGALERFNGFNDGDSIKVIVQPKIHNYKGSLKPIAMLLRIDYADESDVIIQKNIDQLTHLKSLKFKRNNFPEYIDGIKITLIRSSVSAVDEDFRKALGDKLNAKVTNVVPISVLNVDEIVNAINGVKTSVLVLIRGGGDAKEFEVFNHPSVLEAFANSKAYRAIGLGHSADASLLDAFVEYAGSTPTDVGNHLKLTTESATDKSQYIEKLKNQVSEHYVKISNLERQIQKDKQAKLESLEKSANFAIEYALAEVKLYKRACVILVILFMIFIWFA